MSRRYDTQEGSVQSSPNRCGREGGRYEVCLLRAKYLVLFRVATYLRLNWPDGLGLMFGRRMAACIPLIGGDILLTFCISLRVRLTVNAQRIAVLFLNDLVVKVQKLARA